MCRYHWLFSGGTVPLATNHFGAQLIETYRYRHANMQFSRRSESIDVHGCVVQDPEEIRPMQIFDKLD